MEWLSALWSTMYGTIGTAQFWIGIVTSFLFLFIRHRIKLPKIRVSGSHGDRHNLDNGDGFWRQSISIWNDQNFFGYPIDRNSLFVTSARIYDPNRRKYEGNLMLWKEAPENDPHKIEIKVNDKANLYVYSVYKQGVHHYSGTKQNNMNSSDIIVEPGDSRKLEVHILD